MSPSKHVLVIGAGVIGLQTALTLLSSGYAVTVVAEFWPGDENGLYTSPWAGAHWRTHAPKEQKEICGWDTETYRAWKEVVKREREEGRVGESGLAIFTSLHYWDAPDEELVQGIESLWWASVVDDFAMIPAPNLPPGVHVGVSFSAFAINVPHYLQYLVSQIKSLGASLVHAHLSTDQGFEAALQQATDLAGKGEIFAFVNATGIGAKEMVGDESVGGMRGQTVLVRGEAKNIITRLGTGKNNISAIIPRPGSGTTVVGVTKEPDCWELAVSEGATKDLLDGGKMFAPELLDEKNEFEVLRVNVGLRPSRIGGPRVELERLSGGETVVHEYGHAGGGYQNSIGSVNKVLRLLQELD